MVGLVRFYCFRNGVFWIEDCPSHQAISVRRRLRSESVTVTHSVKV